MNWQMLKDSFNLKHNNKIKHVLHPTPAEHTIPNARTTALIPAQQKPQSLTSNKDTSVTAPHLRNETWGGRGGREKLKATLRESTPLTQVWPPEPILPAFCTSTGFKTLSYVTEALDWKIPKIKGLKIGSLLALTSHVGTEPLCP